VTVRVRVAVPSATVAVAALNCSVLSSSLMVTVVKFGVPRVAPTAPERFTLKLRAVLTAPLSAIGTLIVLGAVSPSGQLRVPLVVV
jgi:energy-converting hydrogenase Eha subunit A